MKTKLKTLRKISVAYALQIFAVIILFGYAVASPKTEIKDAINNRSLSLQINKHLLEKDSLLTKKINTLKSYIVKHW